MEVITYCEIPLLKSLILNLIINDSNNMFKELKLNICEYSRYLENQEQNEFDLLISIIVCERDLNETIRIKHKNKNIKTIVIDFSNDLYIKDELFKNKIEGYLTSNSEITDLFLAILQINRGKVYYDYNISNSSNLNRNFYENKKLTIRENEILKLIGLGKRNKEIANSLYISENTVKKHVSNILHKLNLINRAEIISYTYDKGVVQH